MLRSKTTTSVVAAGGIFRGLKRKCLRTVLMSTLALTPAIYGNTSWAAEPNQRYDMQIGATTLTAGLREVESRTGISLAFSEKEVANLRTAGVAGRLTAEEALNALVAGTGLTVRTNGKGVYVVAGPQRTSEVSTFTKVAAEGAAVPPQSSGSSQAASVQPVGPLEEVVVTGSRIVREGYEAPTPLAVIGAEQLANRPDPNLAVLIAEMPAFSGAGVSATTSAGLSSSTSGQSNANLRSLGAERTLILLDGQRTVGSSASGQNVDISSYPQQLVTRVDIVTGGASAVYGSDAVAGVVNFVLDKNFTGIKGDVSAGMTVYGDAKNFSVKLSAGFPFANGRGHVLLSGEESYNGGTDGDGGRKWNRIGRVMMLNPAYTATNGQPNQLVLDNVGFTGGTWGGMVVSGPLKGVAFGQGGVPYQFNYGPITTASNTQGGDWQATDYRQHYQMAFEAHRQNVFARVAYDLTDNVNFHVQSSWTSSREQGVVSPPQTLNATGPAVRIDNAYLPATVRAAMLAANVTTIQVGSWNYDMGDHYADNLRITNQNSLGFDGKFDAFSSEWNWNAYASYGVSRPLLHFYNTFTLENFRLATDAVYHPTTGAIVCRIKLTDPSHPCSPWNPMGIGVNNENSGGRAYMTGIDSQSWNKVQQAVFSASVSGEPFSLPAGPVSLALSAEHRIEDVLNTPDATSVVSGHNVANLPVLDGKQSVTEGAIETVIPIVNDASFADSWDVSAAVRATDYSLAGYVTTWKLGTTFAPIPDIRLRVTRSRDIRAPNIQELFQPSAFSLGTLRDPVTNSTPTVRQFASGNANLEPEKADTLGVGVVLQPSFLEGFSASVDYWNVKLKGGIGTVTSQNIIDYCVNGQRPEFCPNITRINGVINEVRRQNFNIAEQDLRGVDVESSYRFELADVFSDFDGSVTLHGNATFYLRNYQDNKLSPPTNQVGVNSGGSPPNWRLNASATYNLDPITVTVTGRALSSGLLNAEYIECTTGCPTSTAANLTVNNNRLPGAFYLDTNFSYAFDLGPARSTAYFTVKNIFNRDPAQIPTVANYINLATGAAGIYDIMGTVFRAGLRFTY
ncbi:MAG: TonB-dependent receptor [Rhodospirillaceae bacterium]